AGTKGEISPRLSRGYGRGPLARTCLLALPIGTQQAEQSAPSDRVAHQALRRSGNAQQRIDGIRPRDDTDHRARIQSRDGWRACLVLARLRDVVRMDHAQSLVDVAR